MELPLDLTDFNAMRETHTEFRQTSSRGTTWSWLLHGPTSNVSPARNPKHSRNPSAQPNPETTETQQKRVAIAMSILGKGIYSVAHW